MTDQSPNSPTLLQRIVAIMADLAYVQKGDKTVNGQYRFASHDQVTAKVHPMLVKHGVVIVPSVYRCKQDGNRTTVKLGLRVINADNARDELFVRFVGYGVDAGDKGPGKAISYAYKYALLKLFCLETGDDPDNEATAAYEPAKCAEFDLHLPAEMTDKDRARVKKFLQYNADVMKKHVEDVKREALARMPEFLQAFRNWSKKSSEDKEKQAAPA